MQVKYVFAFLIIDFLVILLLLSRLVIQISVRYLLPVQTNFIIFTILSLLCVLLLLIIDVLFDHSSCNKTKDNVDSLWHNRLGHVPFVKLRSISTLQANFSPKQPFSCNICPMARQSRLSFSHNKSQTKFIFELLHIDLWGPYLCLHMTITSTSLHW